MLPSSSLLAINFHHPHKKSMKFNSNQNLKENLLSPLNKLVTRTRFIQYIEQSSMYIHPHTKKRQIDILQTFFPSKTLTRSPKTRCQISLSKDSYWLIDDAIIYLPIIISFLFTKLFINVFFSTRFRLTDVGWILFSFLLL